MKEIKKNCLIIVDFQNDFIDGSLAVPGAKEALENIKKELSTGNYDEIIFTVDWHKMSDKSFKENGGQWPKHCIECGIGAAIEDQLLEIVDNNKISYQIFYKGTCPDKEEYGAFSEASPMQFWNIAGDSYVNYRRSTNYYICGLAGDYCVFETWKNLKRHAIDATPLYDCIGWIGDKFEYHE